LAEPPDTPNEAFLREVDENLRREQMETFAKRYGKWLIAAVVIFLAAVGGWIYWQNKQQEKASAQSEELMSIYNDIGGGRTEVAKRRLQPLESSGNKIIRALAYLTEAAIALDSNDRATALTKYRAIAADDGLPDSYRNLALIRATALEFDTIKPDEVISRLEPLTKPGNPWFGSAGELTAMAYVKEGQLDKAARLFKAMSDDKTVPETIRNRAVQIVGTLEAQLVASAQPTAQPGKSQ
jgi:pentatricopeptide repeat protein